MERRIRLLGVFIVLCFIALFVQLNNIQVFKANSLAASPNNPRIIAVERSQPRGDIVSSDGVMLASSVPTTSGAYKYRRVYNPYTAVLFSQIVGFDSEIFGMTGIEAEYNQYLESHTRPAKSLRDLLVNRTTTDDVTLTINSHLQSQVAAAVDATDVNGSAPEAGAVVLNVKTGAVEAMYSNPPYDPRGLVSTNGNVETFTYALLNYKSPESPLVSRTFQRGFAPGSTFKTVTSAAVYDHDPSLANVDYPPATCIPLPQSNQQLCNYGRNGPNGPEHCGGTIQTTLPQSCDTAFAQLGMAFGGVSLNAEAEAFGFNQRIPLDLPGVVDSVFPSVAELANDKPSQAYSAFGQQNVVANALQMALVADGIANDGVIMTPHVMQSIRDSQGNPVTAYAPKPWLTATSPLTATAVTKLMQGVVNDPLGTAAGVGFPAFWNVAAKTGTAETGPGGLGDKRLDDCLRPCQQSESRCGRRGAQSARQRYGRGRLGPPDEGDPRRRVGSDSISVCRRPDLTPRVPFARAGCDFKGQSAPCPKLATPPDPTSAARPNAARLELLCLWIYFVRYQLIARRGSTSVVRTVTWEPIPWATRRSSSAFGGEISVHGRTTARTVLHPLEAAPPPRCWPSMDPSSSRTGSPPDRCRRDGRR